MDGAELIKQLIQLADDRIIIMPGSGVSSDNIVQIAEITDAVEFHSSARIQEIDKISVDDNEVRQMIAKLSSLHRI